MKTSILPASDADMLRHLMEAKGVTQVFEYVATGLFEKLDAAVKLPTSVGGAFPLCT